MNVYTFSQARQNFAHLLEQAKKEGAVHIKRRDGQTFVLKPETPKKSPLDIQGISLNLSTNEIINSIHKGRRASHS